MYLIFVRVNLMVISQNPPLRLYLTRDLFVEIISVYIQLTVKQSLRS